MKGSINSRLEEEERIIEERLNPSGTIADRPSGASRKPDSANIPRRSKEGTEAQNTTVEKQRNMS